jgi:hypothetical protein
MPQSGWLAMSAAQRGKLLSVPGASRLPLGPWPRRSSEPHRPPLVRNGQNDMLVRISHSHWVEEELILLMNSLEQSLGFAPNARLAAVHWAHWAFQCLLKVGTGQRVSFVSSLNGSSAR